MEPAKGASPLAPNVQPARLPLSQSSSPSSSTNTRPKRSRSLSSSPSSSTDSCSLSSAPASSVAPSSPQTIPASSFPAHSSSRHVDNLLRVLVNSQLLGGTITLRVGPPTKSRDILVHRRTLNVRIERFPTIPEVIEELDDYERNEEGVIGLPHLDADVVTGYVAILYNSKLSYKECITPFHAETAPAVIADIHYVLLMRIYIFALEIGDDDAQDAVLAAVIEASTQRRGDRRFYLPGIEATNILYKGTQEPNVMRDWLIDAYATHSNKEWTLETGAVKYPYEFLQRLTKEYVSRVRVSPYNLWRNRDVNYWATRRR
jgi:hypothetical protein